MGTQHLVDISVEKTVREKSGTWFFGDQQDFSYFMFDEKNASQFDYRIIKKVKNFSETPMCNGILTDNFNVLVWNDSLFNTYDFRGDLIQTTKVDNLINIKFF